MSGGNSYKIPRELIGLLSDHRGFFEAIDGLYEDTGLYLRPNEGDSHLDTEVQDNGDLQVKLVYALDDNDRSEDGRFFVEDQFVLAPDGKFKNFKRSFSSSGVLSEAHPFQAFKTKLESSTRPDQKTAEVFAEAVLVGRPRPLNDLWLEGLKGNSHLANAAKQLQVQLTQWDLQLQHPLSSYILVEKQGELHLVLNIVAQEKGAEDPPEAGRFFLQEKFILDAQTGAFKSHQQNWQISRHSQGDAILQEIVRGLNQEAEPVEGSSRNFLMAVAGILNPVSERKNFDKENWGKLTGNPEYLGQLGEALQSVYSNWTFKPKHSRSGVQLIQWPNGQEIILTLRAEDAFKAGEKAILLREHFYLNESGELSEHQREWVVPEGDSNSEDIQALQKRLSRKKLPPFDVIENVAKELQPILPEAEQKVLQPELGVPEAMDVLADTNPVDFQKAGLSLASRLEESSETAPDGRDTLQGLYFVEVLATERIAQREDASEAWLSSDRDYDSATDKLTLHSLMSKAAAYGSENPGNSVLEVLRGLSLSGREADLAGKLLRDPMVRKISLAASEPNPEFRAKSLMTLASRELWDEDMPGTAGVIAKTLDQEKLGGERPAEIVALMEGEASVGTHLEFVAPKVLNELGEPWMLAGMTLAPFAGVGAEATILARFSGAGKLATAGGILSEAAAFTAVTDVGQSLKHDPDKVWENFHWQTGSTALLFGLLRGAHHLTGLYTVRMAEGKVHPWLGGHPEIAGSGIARGPKKLITPRGTAMPYEHASVNGRVLTAPTPAYNSLSPLGQFASGNLQHSSGILAMWLTNVISGSMLPHVPEQNWRGGFLDAVLGYAHAHAGFRLANGLTGGGLQSNLAQMRLGLKLYDVPAYKDSLAAESARIPERMEMETQALKESLEAQVRQDKVLPETMEFPLMLGQLIPGLFSGKGRVAIKFTLVDAINRFVVSEESMLKLQEALREFKDPRVDALLKEIKNLQINAPLVDSKEEGTVREEGLSQAFAILEDIMRSHEDNPEDKAALEPKFQEVNRILQDHADAQGETQNVAPRVMKIIDQMTALAENLGIDISPPKDMTEKIERMLERFSNQVSRQDGSSVESIVDPSPDESGEFLGGLMGPDGFIGVRLNEPERQLVDLEGNPAAIVYGVEHEGQIVITVQANGGNRLSVKGKELSVDYLFLAEHPAFSVGGKNYRFHHPSQESAEESMIEPTEFNRPEGLDPARTGVYDPEVPETGYEAWLAFEKETAGIGIAKQIPAKVKRTRHPWVTFQLQKSGEVGNLGSANFFNFPRVIIGERGAKDLGPGHEGFSSILGEGVLAPEQAMVYLDLKGNLNIVRFSDPRPEYSVLVDGKELEVHQPVRVFSDSVVQLRGGDEKLYNLDLYPHEKLPQDKKPRPDTFAGLSDPRTTDIDSKNLPALQAKYGDGASPEALTEPESGLTRDTYFGNSLLEPRDGTLYGPAPTAPRPMFEEDSGPLPELGDLDFAHLSRREAAQPAKKDSSEPVHEESVKVHIEIEAENLPGAQVTQGSGEPQAENREAFEDRFDLDEEESDVDLFAGLDDEMAAGAVVKTTPAQEAIGASQSKVPGKNFGPRLEDIRARYSIRYEGEDPLAEAEPILGKDQKSVQQVMIQGRIVSVDALIAELEAKITAPEESALPRTFEDIYGLEAKLLRKLYIEEFGEDLFEKVEPIFEADGSVREIKFGPVQQALEGFLKGIARKIIIHSRRRVPQEAKVDSLTPASQELSALDRYMSLSARWQEQRGVPLIDASQEMIDAISDPPRYANIVSGKVMPLEEFVDLKEAVLNAVQIPAAEDSGSSWPGQEASLSDHIRFLEEEYGYKITGAKIVEPEASLRPEPTPVRRSDEEIEVLDESEYDEIEEPDEAPSSAPPPPPMAKPFPKTEIDRENSVALFHPDLQGLLSTDKAQFRASFNKAHGDIQKYPDRITHTNAEKVEGRVHDALGVLDQIMGLVKKSNNQLNKMSTIQVLEILQEHFHGMFSEGAQDFTIQSDGHQVRFSTFLTGDTRSVGGNIGKPDGMLVLSFHADQNPNFMIQSVFGMLRQANFPVEVIFPIDYQREGIHFIGVKYSGEHMGEAFSLVKEALDKDPQFFSSERIFFSDPVPHQGELWADVGHYSFQEGAENSPLDSLKKMMALAWKSARDPESENPPDPTQFRLELYKLLRDAGWIQNQE